MPLQRMPLMRHFTVSNAVAHCSSSFFLLSLSLSLLFNVHVDFSVGQSCSRCVIFQKLWLCLGRLEWFKMALCTSAQSPMLSTSSQPNPFIISHTAGRIGLPLNMTRVQQIQTISSAFTCCDRDIISSLARTLWRFSCSVLQMRFSSLISQPRLIEENNMPLLSRATATVDAEKKAKALSFYRSVQ